MTDRDKAEAARERAIDAMVAGVLMRAEGEVVSLPAAAPREAQLEHRLAVYRAALALTAADLFDAVGHVSHGYARFGRTGPLMDKSARQAVEVKPHG